MQKEALWFGSFPLQRINLRIFPICDSLQYHYVCTKWMNSGRFVFCFYPLLCCHHYLDKQQEKIRKHQSELLNEIGDNGFLTNSTWRSSSINIPLNKYSYKFLLKRCKPLPADKEPPCDNISTRKNERKNSENWNQ